MREDVGIPAAVDARGRRVARWAVDETPQPFERPLRCAGCSVTVIAVRSGTGEASSRSPYFRRAAHQHHDPNCKYDFERQADKVIEESLGTVIKEDGYFRLLLPDPQAGPGRDETLPDTRQPRRRLQVTSSGQVLLGEVLSSAARIARLLALFDNDPDAAGLFQARYGDQILSWDDFYFEADRIAELHARITRGLAHPVAVACDIDTCGTAAAGDSFFAQHATRVPVPDGATERWARIVVRTRRKPIYRQLQAGRRLLGFGTWETFRTEHGRYVDVRLWVDGQWNLIVDP